MTIDERNESCENPQDNYEYLNSRLDSKKQLRLNSDSLQTLAVFVETRNKTNPIIHKSPRKSRARTSRRSLLK